jgi:hypothetical protein
MDKYFKYGIPKDFKFFFPVYAKRFFDDNWEETGAFTGDLV